MGIGKQWFGKYQALLSMLLVQIFQTGFQILSKVTLNKGTFIGSLMTYRHVVAAICVAPFALLYERESTKKLSWLAGFWLFASALIGILMAMGLYFYGLKDTTATYSTNFLNLIPVVTFLISAAIGLEKVNFRTSAGIFKIMGAVLSVSGAVCIGLLKGAHFHIGHHYANVVPNTTVIAKPHYWVRGSFLLIGSCFCYSIWFVIQAKLMKVFPYKYSATLLTSIIAAVQSAVVGLCIDRKLSAWRLKWDLELLTIVYLGAFCTAATFCLINWVIKFKGPTYTPMFNPLSLVFVAFLDSMLLGEMLYVGTLLGMFLIITGLYTFLWGKTKESKVLNQTIVVDDKVSGTTDPALYLAAVMPSEDIADGGECAADNSKEFPEVKIKS